MRALYLMLPVAVFLAAGCGQKGPLTLKAAPARTSVPAASPPATTAPPDVPGNPAPQDDKKDPADGTTPTPHR